MQTNSVIFNKQLSVKYAGSMQKYQNFKRMMGASPQLYTHDFHIYNDDIISRHNRNIKQIKNIKSLLKEGKIQTSMLAFNVFNTYYPSYVLHHHYEVFVPALSQLANHQVIKDLLASSKKHQVTGAFFKGKIRQDFKDAQKSVATLNDEGIIHMSNETFFFSGVTSPYITHCAFIAHHKSGLRFVVVAIRDKDGSLAQGVKAKDLGAMASTDYIPIGYNLSGVKPLIAVQINTQISRKINAISAIQRFHEFGFSLKDFQKSLWITINYTSMRKQFKTNDNNKEERRIITYQAVASRIINGFAQFVALSDFHSRVVEGAKSYLILNQIIQSSHHIILQNLIHLRECCGGFGFMQVSGHPGCIERVCFRAGSQTNNDLKLSPQYLQITQYYASSQESEKYYCQQITQQKPSYMNYFGIFTSIIFSMRKDKGKLTSLQYKREFLKQSSLLAMHAREEFNRNDATNIHCQLLQFAVAQYILKNTSFINWSLIKIARVTFFERLQEFRNQFLQSISTQLQSLGSTLELSFLRNTIVGRENSDDFYRQVLQTSKGNLRNQKSWLAYVQEPIIEMVTTNRGKL